MGRKKGDYSQIWEWIYANFDVNNYQTDGELLYDVKNEFNKTNSYFPVEAEDLVRERFQYRREYAEMEKQKAEQQQIADFIGSGQIMQGTTDQIVDELRNPKSEIMGIDMTEFATTREEVVPEEIVRFAQSSTFFGRVSTGFKNTLGRIFGRRR